MSEQFYDPASYRARDSVGYLVRRLYSILSNRIEAQFADQGLTLMQWIVLLYLRDELALTASDIAREFRHDSGALTRVIDQLEQRGLLTRERSSRDRRVVELHLTRVGRRTIEKLLPRVVGELNAALAPLSRDEFEQFQGFLLRILDHLQSESPPVVEEPPARATRR
jgi:DNA-binding MarR family transcriptional regulator